MGRSIIAGPPLQKNSVSVLDGFIFYDGHSDIDSGSNCDTVSNDNKIY